MKCPKCGYISFDYNLECPKCRSDMSMEQSKLNLPSFEPSPPFFLGSRVGNEENPVESYPDESAGAGRLGQARSISDADESNDADGNTSFEEAFGSETTDEILTRSGFSPPPPYFRRHIKEIQDLISELVPEKSKTEPDEKNG